MSLLERFLHALLFELGAIAVTLLVMSLLTDHSYDTLGITIVLISLIAMAWNMLFNRIFDYFFRGERLARGLVLRLFHSVIFELGLLLFTVPLVAFTLAIDWWTALITDIGMTLIVMVYALLFNWGYDWVRVKLKS